jgi:hypothetical protein
LLEGKQLAGPSRMVTRSAFSRAHCRPLRVACQMTRAIILLRTSSN